MFVDVNRLGQSQATMFEHDVETYKKKFASFGWNSQVIDGHNVAQIVSALEKFKK